MWRDSCTWYSGCWARVDGSCHRYLPCHGKPPRSHPPLVSGLVFGSGLSGSASGTLQVLNSQSCAELCPQRWSGRGQLTTWPAMQRAQWLLVEVWPWSGMTSTPAIGSSGAPLFLHTHWAAPCVHPPAPAEALPAAAPPMPRVAQEGDEAWPDSGAPLRQRPQDPQPGWTCPWGPGLGREAGRAEARARPPRATSESRTASPCLSFLSPEARAGEHPQSCPRAGVLHVAPLELVRSIYQGRLAPTTFQVRTTLRAGQGRAGGPARRDALQAPTRDRTQGVGDRITKRTLAAHSGEYSRRDEGGRGWARRWRWRGVGGARAGDGQAEPAAWAGRAGRRSRPARDIGGWAGLAPSPTPEA